MIAIVQTGVCQQLTGKERTLSPKARDDHFLVEALDDGRKCYTTSVAAHTLYEKGHPYILHGPGIELDLADCVFEQHTEGTVKVSAPNGAAGRVAVTWGRVASASSASAQPVQAARPVCP